MPASDPGWSLFTLLSCSDYQYLSPFSLRSVLVWRINYMVTLLKIKHRSTLCWTLYQALCAVLTEY